MAKLTIINKDGFTLKNLPGCKFNAPDTKKPSTWTFSAKGVDLDQKLYSDTIMRALENLANAGFTDLQVIPLDENEEASKEIQAKSEKVTNEAQVTNGTKAPELEEFLKESSEGMDDEERAANDEFWAEVNSKCVGCTRSCKQSHRATIMQCPQYDRAVNE